MPGKIEKGTATQPGTSFFLPEWYADLYGKAPVETAYIGGWAGIPNAYLVNGPDLRQMTVVGNVVGSVDVVQSEALGQTAFRFPGGRKIDTGHAATDEFTLIAVVNLTADQLAGAGGTVKGLMQTENTSGARQSYLQISNSGNLAFQLVSGSSFQVVSSLLTAGPSVIMATCRKLAAGSYQCSLFVNEFVTPKASATLAGSPLLGVPWTVGTGLLGLPWTSDVAAFLIAKRDMTKDAADYAAIKSALPLAKAWATPV
jgi:hypothetical protein